MRKIILMALSLCLVMSSFITVSHAKGPKKDTNVEPQTVNVERLDFSELADDVTEGAGERIASGFDS